MKFGYIQIIAGSLLVAPYTGAWIEIKDEPINCNCGFVAPYTGAWIEINVNFGIDGVGSVAPYTGAWIEI